MGKKNMVNMFPDIGDVTVIAEGVVKTVVPVVNVVSKSNAARVGKCGRKRKDGGELPSNKFKKTSHGAGSFLEYQEACKTEATTASTLRQLLLLLLLLLLMLMLLLMMLLLLMLMLMPMLMMLALTLLVLPDAFESAAYVTADNADAETKMMNVARHLAGANVVLLQCS